MPEMKIDPETGPSERIELLRRAGLEPDATETGQSAQWLAFDDMKIVVPDELPAQRGQIRHDHHQHERETRYRSLPAIRRRIRFGRFGRFSRHFSPQKSSRYHAQRR